MKREYYSTKQKEIILNVIEKQRHEFTIKDIYSEIKGKVGLTTIYRLIDRLISENLVGKYISKDDVTYYQYLKKCNEENHFYLKCDECGDLIHIDCDCIKGLSNHILKKHNFILNKKNIIINGICDKCINKGEKYGNS